MKHRAAVIALLFAQACVGATPGASTVSAPDAPASPPPEQVIHVTAQKFEFTPQTIHLKLHVPVVLELTSFDRQHGLLAPDLGLDEVIRPGETTRVHLVPDKPGTFDFHCSVFCGSGHEGMAGRIVVEP